MNERHAAVTQVIYQTPLCGCGRCTAHLWLPPCTQCPCHPEWAPLESPAWDREDHTHSSLITVQEGSPLPLYSSCSIMLCYVVSSTGVAVSYLCWVSSFTGCSWTTRKKLALRIPKYSNWVHSRETSSMLHTTGKASLIFVWMWTLHALHILICEYEYSPYINMDILSIH